MKTVAVVYYSGTGHTLKMAEAVARGVEGVNGVQPKLITIENSDIVEGQWQNDEKLDIIDGAEGVILGSPTYMGCVAGQFECFLDATAGRWFLRAWLGKVAGGFTVSGSPSGDKVLTLLRLSTFALQHGMIWVGLEPIPDESGINRLGFFSGAGAQAGPVPPEIEPVESDLRTGELLGGRVAEVTLKLAAPKAG